MDFKDVSGLGKSFKCLIETIGRGVGSFSESYIIKKNADAKAHEIKTIVCAIAESTKDSPEVIVGYKEGRVEVIKPNVGVLADSADLPIEKKMQDRLVHVQKTRQKNIEQVTAAAAAHVSIEDESDASQVPDDDWINRFFDYGQDIGTPEMQELWGRILAGEVTRPGSFSLRTLDFLRNLSKGEAETLKKVLEVSCVAPGGLVLVPVFDKDWLKNNKKIYPSQQFLLGELGAMYQTDLTYNLFSDANASEAFFIFGEFIFVIKRSIVKSQINLPVWKFTGTGSQLSSLVTFSMDMEYMDHVASFFVKKGAEVVIGKITERNLAGNIAYNIIKKIPAAIPA